MVPTIYGVLMIFIWAFLNGNGVINMTVIATLFAGTAVAFATALGGANITPAMLALGFLGLNILRREGLKGFTNPFQFATPTFWLLLLTIWGVASAFVLPRFFEGQFMVSTFDRGDGGGGGSALDFVKPVSMNITQALYAFLAFMTFVMTRTILGRVNAYALVAKAVLWVAALNALAAILNLAQYYAGFFPILTALKNAKYLMMGGEVAGLMRVSGTFPEASMFSQYTLGIVAFTHVLWMRNIYKGWARALTLLNVFFLLISTSGTAYVSLAICMTVALAYAFWHVLHHGRLGIYKFYIYISFAGVFFAVAVLLFVPPALDAVINFFDIVIGRKMTSVSGVTRMRLNAQAWQTFIDTYGLGAGLGSNRASSFVMVVLSNVGWIGTVLLVVFIWGILFGQRDDQAAEETQVIVLAARYAVFASLVSACLVGLVYDLGFMFYIMAGLAYLPPKLAPKLPSTTLGSSLTLT